MPIHPANANELATIALEVGAEVLEGNLRYPSESGSWQLGDVDLGCPGVDYMRLWPLPVEQPWQETPDPTPEPGPGWYARRPDPAVIGGICDSA